MVVEQYSIGLDLGGTNLRAAAVNRDGTLMDSVSGRTPYTAGREAIVRDMVDSIDALRGRFGRDKLCGIGVAVPGFIFATGFSGHGFAMGPIIGKVLAEIIADGKSSFDLRAMEYARFAEGRVGKPKSVV